MYLYIYGYVYIYMDMDIDTYLDIDTHTHISLSLCPSLPPSLPFSLFSLYTLFAQFFHNISLPPSALPWVTYSPQTSMRHATGLARTPCGRGRPWVLCQFRAGRLFLDWSTAGNAVPWMVFFCVFFWCFLLCLMGVSQNWWNLIIHQWICCTAIMNACVS